MMTLEEAIAHCKEKALSCSDKQRECALEHIQLMDWLKELKCLRKVVDKKYIEGISVLKSAFGEEYDKYFEIELRQDMTGMFRRHFSDAEMAKILEGRI